jgi:formylglycine-generating enzyme required for sulfatase activity
MGLKGFKRLKKFKGNNSMNRTALVLLFVLLISVAAQAQKLTVSVMDLNVTEGLSGREVMMLTDCLLNEFVVLGTYKVVERSKRDEILKEQGFQQSGACDQGACLVEAGQLLGVQKMVGGTIGRLGAVYAVELRIMDVKTGEIERAFSRKYTGDVSNLLDAMSEAASAFSGKVTNETPIPKTMPKDIKGLTYLQKNAQGYNEYLNPKDSSVLIEIPDGVFIMGSDDGYPNDIPVQKLYLNSYFISKFEVTVRQFKKFVNATRYKTDAENSKKLLVIGLNNSMQQVADANWGNPYFRQSDNNPVGFISWNDAKAYCKWAGLRLPNEVEWEKAARGTDGRQYPWGNDWDASKCNSGAEGDGFIHSSPSGAFSNGVSPYGCFDMAGNVFEWCEEVYHGEKGDGWHMVRGGSWFVFYDICRSSSRVYRKTVDLLDFVTIGFRVAR